MKTIKQTEKTKKVTMAAPSKATVAKLASPSSSDEPMGKSVSSSSSDSHEHTMLVVFALAIVLIGALFIINMINVSMRSAKQVKGAVTNSNSEETTIQQELHDIDILLYESNTHKDSTLPQE